MIVTVEEAAEKLATSLHSKLGDSDYDLLQLGASGLELEERIEKAILTGMVRPRSGLTGAYDDSQAFLGKRALVQFEDVITFLQGEGMQLDCALTSGAPESETPRRHVYKQQFQEREILRVIRELGHDPKALPKDTPGKPGAKAAVRRELPEFSPTVFDKAWDRLSASKEIIKLK